MKRFIRALLDWFVFLLTGKGDIGQDAVDEGLVNYSGQGRDQYGR